MSIALKLQANTSEYGSGFSTPLVDQIGGIGNLENQFLLQGKFKVFDLPMENGRVLAKIESLNACPHEIRSFVAMTHGGSVRLDLHPNGDLKFNSTGGQPTDWICIDGLTYFTGAKG